MDKQDVKIILMSMRTPENESVVNNLLGKIDVMDENSLSVALQKVGYSEESVRSFFENKLSEARLAIQIFGRDRNIGTASIQFETIFSREWQEKKQKQYDQFIKKKLPILDFSVIQK